MTRTVLLLVPTAAEARGILGDPVPTGPGGAPVEAFVGSAGERRPVRVALCGFGPVAAGILAAEAIARAQPDLVLLAGVAGTYQAGPLPVASLLVVSEARAEVGRGRGPAFRSAAEMGFPQVPDDGGGEVLSVGRPGALSDAVGPHVSGGVLTVACASATPAEAEERAARESAVLAEDMESYAVALACRRRGAHLEVLRGISNVAGDPDRSRWRLGEALDRLRDAVARAVASR